MDLLPAWFPQGKVIGSEFAIGSLNGESGQSLKVSITKGIWKDWATDEGGSDLISLYAAIHGIGQGEAAKDLAKEIGFRLGGKPQTESAQPRKSKRQTPAAKPAESLTVGPPPAGTPKPEMKHPVHGTPSKSWEYRGAEGQTLFHVARYDSGPTEKHFLPWSWSTGDSKWVSKGWAQPRPLYGLELLAARPAAPILIVEGEKSADAARGIAGKHYVVMAWPNGAQAALKSDWTPIHGRKVVLWPDADAPGAKAMAELAAHLHPYCLEVKLISLDPPDAFTRQPGFDAADALAGGWNWDSFKSWAKPRVHIYAPPAALKPDPEREKSAEKPQPIPEREQVVTPLDPPTAKELQALAESDARTKADLFSGLCVASDEEKQSQIADSLVRAADGKVIHDDATGRFYVFDKVWRPMMESDVHRRIQRVFDSAFVTGYSASQLSSVSKLFRLAVGRGLDNPVEWDERGYIPVQNGLLNLQTKQLEPFDREKRLDWILPFDYQPGVECPTIREFLKNLAQGNPKAEELSICYLWAVLYGRSDLQKYLELIGKPGTGKSTYIQLAGYLMGAQNTVITTMRQLSENRFETSSFYGKRLAVITDADKWAGSIDTFKAMVGQDPIRYEEKMKQQGRPFVFGGMIIVAANSAIQSNEQSTALVRRRLSIHMDKFFPEAKQDAQLLRKFRDEMPGLLNWLLSLDEEQVVGVLRDKGNLLLESRRRALIETDAVAAWIDDNLVYEPGEAAQVGRLRREGSFIQNHDVHLYPNFVEYLESNGRSTRVTLQNFSIRLVEILGQCGYETEKRDRSYGRVVLNVRLRCETDHRAPRPISVTKMTH
jgi:P4 family phage/plasmid primase-like protien